jgi:hypothetical protein
MKKLTVFSVAVIFGFISIFLNYTNFFSIYFLILEGVVTALIFGYAANRWPWARGNSNALILGAFCGGFTALLPVIFASYGLGLMVIVPFLFLWSGLILFGIRLQRRSLSVK